MACVPFSDLLEFKEGHFSQGSVKPDLVVEHLASGCLRCGREMEWIERFLALVREDTSVEPPEWVVRRAIALFPQTQPEGVFAWPGKIVAALVFDSYTQPHLAGLRRGKIGEMGRQLLYKAGNYDIDLRFIPVDPRSEDIVAQVLSSSSEGLAAVSDLEIQAYKGKRKIASAKTDAFGMFYLTLPQGSFLIRVKTKNGEVELPQVVTSLFKG